MVIVISVNLNTLVSNRSAYAFGCVSRSSFAVTSVLTRRLRTEHLGQPPP
jgi:hypothetical protein